MKTRWCWFAAAIALLWASDSLSKDVQIPAIPGWETAGQGESFDTSTLWNAINGGAEIYLAYGFQQLKIQDVKQGTVVITVSVFDMGKPLHAFGIFKRERPSKGVELDAGAESIAWLPYQCLLFKDRFYVKIAGTRGKLTDDSCKTILHAMAAGLPGDNSAPKELALLPGAGRLHGSEAYTREGYLGTSDLENCVHAMYGDKEEPFQMFVVLPPEGKSTDEVWKNLESKWQKVDTGKLPALKKEIPYRGDVTIARHKTGILGVAEAKEPMAVLQRAIQELEPGEKEKSKK